MQGICDDGVRGTRKDGKDHCGVLYQPGRASMPWPVTLKVFAHCSNPDDFLVHKAYGIHSASPGPGRFFRTSPPCGHRKPLLTPQVGTAEKMGVGGALGPLFLAQKAFSHLAPPIASIDRIARPNKLITVAHGPSRRGRLSIGGWTLPQFQKQRLLSCPNILLPRSVRSTLVFR